MTEKTKFEHELFGYRDIIYFQDSEMYLSINSEMDAINRIDSYFKNSKLLWSKKKPNLDNIKEFSKKKIANLELHAKISDNLNQVRY
jgi:hypothetical protein